MQDGMAGSGQLPSVQQAGAYAEGHASSRLGQDGTIQDQGRALHRCASAMHNFIQCIAAMQSLQRHIFL